MTTIDREHLRKLAQDDSGLCTPVLGPDETITLLDMLDAAEWERDNARHSRDLWVQHKMTAEKELDDAQGEIGEHEARELQVRRLHHRWGDTASATYVCNECDKPYPCPTVRALDGD